jgi:hypothetical protein
MKSTPLTACAAGVLCIGLGAVLVSAARPERVTLWPGARFSYQDRTRAVERGMEFIYKVARDPSHFKDWGHDLLWCFYTIWASAQDPGVKRLAWEMGHERALEWRRLHHSIPPKIDGDEMTNLVIGSDSADWLGVPNNGFKEQLRRAAARLSPEDYFGFNPVKEPPPLDIPEPCERCGEINPRGSKQCRRCGAALEMTSRYDVWCDALITAHAGRHYGITLGVPYADVARWLPVMRPYPAHTKGSTPEFYDVLYAITHLIYTLNDYNIVHIGPGCLPQEFEYLTSTLHQAMEMNNPDMVGEFMDTLRTFGLTESDPLVRKGEEYLLSTQNPDGSWGDTTDPDIYGRYHPTWTAVDGLRTYRWDGYLTCPF